MEFKTPKPISELPPVSDDAWSRALDAAREDLVAAKKENRMRDMRDKLIVTGPEKAIRVLIEDLGIGADGSTGHLWWIVDAGNPDSVQIELAQDFKVDDGIDAASKRRDDYCHLLAAWPGHTRKPPEMV